MQPPPAPTWMIIVSVIAFLATPGLLLMLFFSLKGTHRTIAVVRSGPVRHLMALSGRETPSALLNDALCLYEHMAEELMKGNLVGVKNKQGEFMMILTPGLEWARQVGQVTGAADADAEQA